MTSILNSFPLAARTHREAPETFMHAAGTHREAPETFMHAAGTHREAPERHNTAKFGYKYKQFLI